MLVILVGPTSMGKGSVIKSLKEIYGWKKVPTYSNRAKRLNDDKIYLDEALINGGDYFVQRAYGNVYAQKRVDIYNLSLSHDVYVFDISFDYVKDFNKYTEYFFSIIPESESDYVNNVIKSGREERLEQAIKEYRFLVSKINSSPVFPIVTNDISQACKIINERVGK
ncbi:hypothetical protein [Pseudoalteromonas piscicida]|uniref:hypothetical protein n=1 Tax=Pseudoalteromonas piscicida TaxID=43662 RepID=UPI003C7A33DE